MVSGGYGRVTIAQGGPGGGGGMQFEHKLFTGVIAAIGFRSVYVFLWDYAVEQAAIR